MFRRSMRVRVAISKWITLQSVIAFRYGALGRIRERCDLHVILTPAIVVHAHFIAKLPTEQFINWDPQDLSLYVPERLFNCAYGSKNYRATTFRPESVVIHL